MLDYSGISDLPDTDLCEQWTRDHGVASIPLSVFYADGSAARRLRFCFAKSDAVLDEAARRLCAI